MEKLIERFSNLVKASLTGFDRIVFKGFILPLMAAKGAMSFCRANGILNKDYKKWMMQQVLGPYLSYYWTMWQSEWATDLIFTSPKDLNPIMDCLLRHAHMTGTSTRVLRYLDRPLTLSGRPYAGSKNQVATRVTDFNDGIRLRHWVDNNSVKVYNEQNVLRVETTINDPGKFRVFRHKQGESCDNPKSRLALRKGVADVPLRAIVSQEINNRFMDDLSTLQIPVDVKRRKTDKHFKRISGCFH